MSTAKPFILVDGSSYLFRAFHALPPLTNTHGEATGAMHGVLNMLDKLRKDYQPEHMVVVFDASGKTFRDELFPAYKANRVSMPEELRSQIEPLLTMIRAQGYPLLVIEGVEADDVIGTLALQCEGQVIISTGDKDMAQLVNERVHLINTMSDSYLDVQGVIDKYGVPPHLIRDYLALMGDKVDNVPGVEKVGPKTAVKWLKDYGSLHNIIERADEFRGKIGEHLRNALAHLPLSYELVTIKCDVALDCHPEQLRFNTEDKALLRILYERYDFRTRLKALDQNSSTTVSTIPASPNIPTQYETILTAPDLDKWLAKLKAAGVFAFDTETTDLDYMQARLVGVSFAVTAGEAAYLPLAHDYLGAPQQLPFEETLAQLKPLLENPNLGKIGQNLKYDRSVLLNYGIILRGIVHDTLLQSYVLDSTANRYDLGTLCQKYLGQETISFTTVAGKGKNQLTFNQIPLEQATEYAAEDADMVLRLHQYCWEKLQELPAQCELYQQIELPLVEVLSDMERTGVKIDANLLLKQSIELAQRMDDLAKKAYTAAGEVFNLSSPKQIQTIFFEKLKLPIIRKTPKGQASTAEDVLEELAQMGHELPRLILQYRSLSKLKSTYTDKLPEQINAHTQRVHTSYHQAGTVTGRLSSSDPNLQNIPIRNEEGRRIRQAFVAADGFTLVAIDYSQIELRIMAHLSGDQGLVSAFQQGADIHCATASEVFGIPLEQVSTEQRRAAKAINFGLIYGMSAFGLAKQLGIERHEAQDYVDLYFTRYPKVKIYMDNIREQAKKQGYVETLFGRRLYLPEINSRNVQQRQYAERTAINAPMQGTAADIIKKAMLKVASLLEQEQAKTRMIMQVHDELVFEMENTELNIMTKIIYCMTNAVELSVPLLVTSGSGKHWDEAH